jgi:hypothetical protein
MQCGELICFDETLFANRGDGYGFRIYIKGKPWKFGILYRSLNDATVPYTYQGGILCTSMAVLPIRHS